VKKQLATGNWQLAKAEQLAISSWQLAKAGARNVLS
jgi:hypothetical protein